MRVALDRWLEPLAWANLVANIGIVVTGAAVRVTGSGLGCPTWPRCTEDSYVPHGALGIHGAIEFGNRLVTFLLAAIALACVAAAWSSWRNGHSTARPLLLAAGVALGIPAQAVLGGFTVLSGLDPYVVALHLLLSMAIIALCVVLLDALRAPEGEGLWGGRRVLAWGVFAALWVVLVLGAVVTGSGPHSGDLDARRTGLDPESIARVHALAAYGLVAANALLLFLVRRVDDRLLRRASLALLLVLLAQAAIGILQYHLQLPPALVILHLLGAAVATALATRVVLSARPAYIGVWVDSFDEL